MQLKNFRFWCQRVLPLVYDDSLSYYEILCKVVKYINELIDDQKKIINDIDALRLELDIIQNWIDNFDSGYVDDLIREALADMIYVWITDTGYIVYYIPDSWDDIVFNTTGYDIDIAGTDYGHLVLSLWEVA